MSLMVTSTGREISAAEAEDLKQMVFDSLGTFIDDYRFKLIMQPPPAYAIKTREGGGGTMLPYLKHGYVRLKLTQLFGVDWSHELLPVFGGEPYRLTPGDDSRVATGNPTVTVYGKLTVNLYDPDSGKLAATITRTGFGSSEWRNKQELGDVLKSAQSDALKVAAATLGPALGLTLYWDDEAEIQRAEVKQRQRQDLEQMQAALDQQKRNTPPTSLPDLLTKAKALYGLGMPQVAERLGVAVKDVSKAINADLAGSWQKVVASMTPKEDATPPAAAADQPASA